MPCSYAAKLMLGVFNMYKDVCLYVSVQNLMIRDMHTHTQGGLYITASIPPQILLLTAL